MPPPRPLLLGLSPWRSLPQPSPATGKLQLRNCRRLFRKVSAFVAAAIQKALEEEEEEEAVAKKAEAARAARPAMDTCEVGEEFMEV